MDDFPHVTYSMDTFPNTSNPAIYTTLEMFSASLNNNTLTSYVSTVSWITQTTSGQHDTNLTNLLYNTSNLICGNTTRLDDSDYSYLMASFIYVCLLLFIGFPGNALVIYVYLLKWPKSTSRIFILALATYDILNCATSMPFEIVLLINFANFDYPVLCKISRFITGLVNNTTTFLLIVIAVDRFKRICRPHNHNITPRAGINLVLLGTVFGICTNWPMLILYGTMTIPHGKTCLIEDKWLVTKYPIYFILFLLLGHFVTDCVLITLYAFVGKAIFKRRHILKSTSARIPKAEISQSSYTVDELDSNETEQKRRRLASFAIWNKVSDEFRKRSITTDGTRKGKRPCSEKKSVSLFRRALSRISDKENNGNKARVGKTTLMLFLVTVVFIVSFIPHTGMVILRYVHPEYITCFTYLGKSLYQLTLRSYLLNSVLNPVVYCFVSNQFRSKCVKALKQLFCCSGSEGNSRTVSGAHSEQ